MKGRSKRVALISGEHVFVTQQPLCLSVGLKSALLFGQLAFAFLQNPLLASRVLQREGGYLEDQCLEVEGLEDAGLEDEGLEDEGLEYEGLEGKSHLPFGQLVPGSQLMFFAAVAARKWLGMVTSGCLQEEE